MSHSRCYSALTFGQSANSLGKRNTSLAFFTSYERSQLKSQWGSQKARLTRDSFLPLGSCYLCLNLARDPVACRDGGHIFCRECAVSNLLSQRKEIKRLQKEDERRKAEIEDAERIREEEEKEGVMRGFERAALGFDEPSRLARANEQSDATRNEGRNVKGVKRKFVLDDEEMSRNAREERAKIRKEIDEENVCCISRGYNGCRHIENSTDYLQSSKSKLPFWIPANAPEASVTAASNLPLKLHPVCPSSASEKSPHPLSLKTLVAVTFSTPQDHSHGTSQTSTDGSRKESNYICPSCNKVLSGSSKAMLTVPCGHVICKPCMEKFMKPTLRQGAQNTRSETRLVCYVCETDLSDTTYNATVEENAGSKADSGKRAKEKDKERLKPGLVELSTQGTGFAGGGNSVIGREGVAFQC